MSESTKTAKATSYVVMDPRVDELKEDQMDLHKSVAVLSERIQGVVEKIEISFDSLSEKMTLNSCSTDKLTCKMDEWVEISHKTEKRLEKVEDHIEKKTQNANLFKNSMWGLLIAACSVFATKMVELLWQRLL